MKTHKPLPFAAQIRWRIRGLWCLLCAMLIYMVVVSELGGGDSRFVTRLADFVGDVIFFGGMIYVGCKIHRNKKLLQYPNLLKAQRLSEQDERNRYLHDKSGGLVWDIQFFCLLFATLTASLFNMTIFNVLFGLLLFSLLLKAASYFFCSRFS